MSLIKKVVKKNVDNLTGYELSRQEFVYFLGIKIYTKEVKSS